MEVNARLAISETLKKAAEGTISEEQFWTRFRDWSSSLQDSRIMIAWEQAEHFWNNFHARNVLLIPIKPDRAQLEQGKEALYLLARAFEGDWSEKQMEEQLREI